MKPLLPRSDSYLVPFQLPAATTTTTTTSIFLPTSYSPQVQLRPAPQRTRDTPRANKRVRIAPKVILLGRLTSKNCSAFLFFKLVV